MKKILITLALVCSLVACSGKVEQTSTIDTAKVDTTKVDTTKRDTVVKKDTIKVAPDTLVRSLKTK